MKNTMTFGELNTLIMSDIPALTQKREVFRAANRVIRDINTKYPGKLLTEKALERIVVNTTEALTFAVAAPDTILTVTDMSASIKPGYVAVIYDSAHNDGVYVINSVATTTITLVADEKLVGEIAVTCTIAIFDLNAKKIIDNLFATFTYVTTTHLITDVNSEINFEALGVKAGDIAVIVGSALNEIAVSIASVSNYVITVHSDEVLTDDADDPCHITIVRPTYSFDAEYYELTLPAYVKKIYHAYENNVELENRGLEYTIDSDNSTELIYTITERSTIVFPSGILDAANDIIKVKMLKELEELPSDNAEIVIDIPRQLEQCLINGVMTYLLAKPKFKDADLFALNKGDYEKRLEDVGELEIQRYPSSNADQKYIY